MIVVDCNIIAYLWLPGDKTTLAEQIYRKDADWIAPLLWRFEFQNVLSGYLRLKRIDLATAQKIALNAEESFLSHEFIPSAAKVLALAYKSSCSAYDCAYVALAEEMKTKLVTTDKSVINHFPAIAIGAAEFV